MGHLGRGRLNRWLVIGPREVQERAGPGVDQTNFLEATWRTSEVDAAGVAVADVVDAATALGTAADDRSCPGTAS